jgi:FG-GAP-like repeat
LTSLPTYTGLFASPFGLAAVELSGDGHPDLIAGGAGEVGALVTVLRGEGDGSFGEEEQYELEGDAVFGLTVADFDGDGKSLRNSSPQVTRRSRSPAPIRATSISMTIA